MRNKNQSILVAAVLLLSFCSFCYLNFETNHFPYSEMAGNSIKAVEGADVGEIKIIKLILTKVSDMVFMH